MAANPPIRNVYCKGETGTRHVAYITWLFRSVVALNCSQSHYTLEHVFVEILGLWLLKWKEHQVLTGSKCTVFSLCLANLLPYLMPEVRNSTKFLSFCLFGLEFFGLCKLILSSASVSERHTFPLIYMA